MNATNNTDHPMSADALAGTIARAIKARAKKTEELSAKITATETMATFLPSGGALGALFHIHLLNGLIVDLDHGDEPSPEFEAATRILYSLRTWIEETAGVSADQVGGEFYMGEKFNPNYALQAA